MEPVGAGHRWRSLWRSEWLVGVAEQRRQPRGHRSELQRRCWVIFRSRSRLRAFGQHMEPVGAGHRWRSLLRLQWRVGVAEQRRQPRGHWSELERRCWVRFRSRSRLRAFGQHMEQVGAGHRWRSPRRVAIGASNNNGAGSDSGHVRVFGLSGNTWSQLGQDIDGEARGDYSGMSVSLSSDGSRVAIGATWNGGAGSRSGHVRVFGTEAPTPVPSPAPPAATAAAVGDPHLVNMYGERFDLLKVGKHLLVEVPQFAAESATLLAVAAVAQRLGDACSDVYFVSLNVTGKWADGVREGGFHYTAKQPQAHRKGTGWLSFHSIQLKTVWGRTGGGISYLNLFVKNLGKSGYPVGGLLGGGDHSSVTKPVLRCKRELVL
ncbi:unnamed protein product [Prorocentrum cordatum]|uniref:Uncharacterized protein n=1 Tax=Prorocentrum cordatum TaxID=2364126 RepID=A0ABN9P8J9_9DINO|nr:unnamed protein product [Polarella glacialis]